MATDSGLMVRQGADLTLGDWLKYCNVNLYAKSALKGFSPETPMVTIWECAQDPRVIVSILETMKAVVIKSTVKFDKLEDPIFWNAIAVGMAFACSHYTPRQREKFLAFLRKSFIMTSPRFPAAACDMIRNYIECPFNDN